MKRYTLLYLFSWLFAFTACTEDDLVNQSEIGEEVLVTLDFGHRTFEDVRVESRYTLSDVQESLVNNLFVYVFSADGKRIYSHYFDSSNKLDTKTAFNNASGNCWYVDNQTADGTTSQTIGSIKMKAPTVSGGKLYLLANVDNTTLRVSSEKLNTVNSISDLNAITAYLAEDISARTPGFLMVAEETVSITNNGGTSTIAVTETNSDDNNRADLIRLDAKIEVKVKTAEGTDATTTYNGATQTVKEFIPKSWRVMNLPRRSNLTLQATDYEENSITDGYFDAPELHFEKTTYLDGDTIHSFSFYMMENRETSTATVDTWTYDKRDLRSKDSNGAYDTSSGLWEYAPEQATYLIIDGELQMDVSTSNTGKQLLVADVTYYVHLGNIDTTKGGSLSNFSVERNTHYTYNITIKGVKNIQVEVEKSQPGETFSEPQPGAMGNVYKADEEIHTFDAHYGQKVYRITEGSIKIKDGDGNDESFMTWYVKTPFGREGTPKLESGTEVPDDLDYKWVKFMVNPVVNGAYSTTNQFYPGDNSTELMDVMQLMKYLKEQKELYDDENTRSASAFINGELYITAFVDEFYYEKHPITGASSGTLWKEFVNQPPRLMHILCDNTVSKDGDSSVTGSIITIRQRSIQTPYDPLIPTLENAWGCETVDEYADSGFFFFGAAESLTSSPSISNSGNSSRSNGLYNTAKLLGTVIGDKWDTYLNINDSHLLNDDYKTLLHSVLTRNRDNNGDNIIDAEELRWYIASIEQLYGIYIGELGMDADAKLYRSEKANATGTYPATHPFAGKAKWREHVVSSTRFSSTRNAPIILWAEEGVSVSWYRREIDENWNSVAPYSVRCVRNLGLGNHPTSSNIGDESSNVVTGTDELIQEKKPSSVTVDAVYEFDLMNVNETSLRRIYYEGELPPSDENSKLSAPYFKGFITGPRISYTSGYDALKTNLENGAILHTHEGYRVPNIRELALMYVFCDNSTWWGGAGGSSNNYLSTTYYSLGSLGTGKVSNTTWFIGYDFASLGASAQYIRLVKDIE